MRKRRVGLIRIILTETFFSLSCTILVGCANKAIAPRPTSVLIDCGSNQDAIFHVTFQLDQERKKLLILSANRRVTGQHPVGIPVENYNCVANSRTAEYLCATSIDRAKSHFRFLYSPKNLDDDAGTATVILPNFSREIGGRNFSCHPFDRFEAHSCRFSGESCSKDSVGGGRDCEADGCDPR